MTEEDATPLLECGQQPQLPVSTPLLADEALPQQPRTSLRAEAPSFLQGGASVAQPPTAGAVAAVRRRLERRQSVRLNPLAP